MEKLMDESQREALYGGEIEDLPKHEGSGGEK